MKKDKFKVIKEMYAVNDSNSAFLSTSSLELSRYVQSKNTQNLILLLTGLQSL